MKKPAKKAASKKADKPKLIEGKYSHKFLTRLHPETGTQLEALKTHFNEKTLNGTIVALIARYTQTYNELNVTKNTLRDLQSEHSFVNGKLSLFTDALKALLSEPKKKEPSEHKQQKKQLAIDEDFCSECGEPLNKYGLCSDCD